MSQIAMMGATYEEVQDKAELRYQLAKAEMVFSCSEELGSVMELPLLNAFKFVVAPVLQFCFPHTFTWAHKSEAISNAKQNAVPKIAIENDYEYNQKRSLYVEGVQSISGTGSVEVKLKVTNTNTHTADALLSV